MTRAEGPFKVLKNINENAYKLDLPIIFEVSPTFNITDLKPYLGEEDEPESRMTKMQEGEDDDDINTSDTSTHNQIASLTTQARACQLNYQVTSFLASYSSYLDNENVRSLLLLRNDGQEGNRVGFTWVTFGFQNNKTCEGRPDHVWTWILVCKYFLESPRSLLSYA
jgi:hypothetical protein